MLDAKWPGLTDSEFIRNCRNSAHTCGSCSTFSRRRSSGESIVGNRGAVVCMELVVDVFDIFLVDRDEDNDCRRDNHKSCIKGKFWCAGNNIAHKTEP